MSHRQHESVSVRPNGIVRVKLHDSLPKTVGHRSHGHRCTWVTGVGLLHGIHGKSTDRIDAGLIELCLCHSGPLRRGVFLRYCRLPSVDLTTIYLGRIEGRLKGECRVCQERRGGCDEHANELRDDLGRGEDGWFAWYGEDRDG